MLWCSVGGGCCAWCYGAAFSVALSADSSICASRVPVIALHTKTSLAFLFLYSYCDIILSVSA